MTRVRRADESDWLRPADVDANAVVSVFRVPPEVAGQRLDVFLQGQLKRTSRTRTQLIIRASAYDDTGRRLRPNDRVRPFQQILLWRAPWDENPVPTHIPVVYEDDYLLAVDKPAHLPVHPSARYHRNTLIKLMQARRPGEWLSLAHRIDRETSGVLLIAKDPETDRALKHAFEDRAGIEKTYLALTWNVPSFGDPAADAARRFRYERSVELDPSHSTKVKMRLGRTDDALYAATRFEILAVRRARSHDGTSAAEPRGGPHQRTEPRLYSRVRCELETGRQHQIRLHLASLGAPIVGDKLYGPDDTCFARGADGELTDTDNALLELPRHALHAWRLSLPHPVTGQPLSIEAPMPRDLEMFWDTLVEA
jgi:23S rRNA pseudouridine1911/1915/1917 synthase